MRWPFLSFSNTPSLGFPNSLGTCCSLYLDYSSFRSSRLSPWDMKGGSRECLTPPYKVGVGWIGHCAFVWQGPQRARPGFTRRSWELRRLCRMLFGKTRKSLIIQWTWKKTQIPGKGVPSKQMFQPLPTPRGSHHPEPELVTDIRRHCLVWTHHGQWACPALHPLPLPAGVWLSQLSPQKSGGGGRGRFSND